MEDKDARTLAEVILPKRGIFQYKILRQIILTAVFSLLIAASAQISIRLPFTSVPITGQTFSVLVTGAALGTRSGALSVILYIVEGSLGLPFFAGGYGGPFWNLSSGGYIIGFVPAAYLVGFLSERSWDRKANVTLALLLGNAVIYSFGLPWLFFFIANDLPPLPGSNIILRQIIPGANILEKTLVGGFWPFIPGDLIKLYLASMLLPAVWVAVRKFKSVA